MSRVGVRIAPKLHQRHPTQLSCLPYSGERLIQALTRVEVVASTTGPYRELQALLGRIPMRYTHLRAEDLVGRLG
jgi:hypothetical protein